MKGSQEPRLKIFPDYKTTDGTDAGELMAAYGSRLDQWQQDIVNVWLATDESGAYIDTSAGLSVPRQNGKNVCIEAREFYGLIVNGERILHTAHQVKTSKKSFRRMAAMFEDRTHPEIMALVKQIRRTNGEEEIELKNGGLIGYSARSRQSARGFDGISLIVYDEAQELTDDQLEATLATLAASATGTRQSIYAGTPPYPGCPGTVFKRRRKICQTVPGMHDSWHEWSIPGDSIEDIKLDDTGLWYMSNPALGIRLTEEQTEVELKSMSPDGFARERLGWWKPEFEKRQDLAIDPEAWAACRSGAPKPEGKTAYGIKFTLDGSEVVLCGAVIPKEGPARISLIERQPTGRGTQWLADWLTARYKQASCIVIDGRNGVDVLIEKIADTWRAKGSVIKPNVKQVIASVGMLTDAINEKKITWYDKQPALEDSALSAVKRPIGGGYGFGGENAAPIEAAALAYWGAKTCKRDPSRKMRIG